MKINFSFSRLIENDKIVKVISVIIGIILWFIVAITISQDGTTSVSKIPVDFSTVNTTPSQYGLSVIEGDDQTVDITVDGKRTKIGNLSNKDFLAIPVLTSVTKPGEYEVPVDIKKRDDGDNDYQVSSSTQKIKVRFDKIDERTFDLFAVAENIHAASGFLREEPYTSPEKVTLKGPVSELDKVAKCVVSTTQEETADEILTVEGKLIFFDANNNKVTLEKTTYKEEKYEITVPIQKHKTVPFKVNFVNIPQGIDPAQISYTLSEETIEISGQKSVVDECKEITLGTVDFRAIDIGSSFAFDVALYNGISNVNNLTSVTVTMNPEGLASQQFTIPKANILTQNEPASYQVDVKTTSINNVKIVGKKEDIEKMAANDLVAIIDFKNFEVSDGNSRVPVVIYATGNKFVWAVGEYYALINAEKN